MLLYLLMTLPRLHKRAVEEYFLPWNYLFLRLRGIELPKLIMDDLQWMLAWRLLDLTIKRSAVKTSIGLAALLIDLLDYPTSPQVIKVWATQASEELSTIGLVEQDPATSLAPISILFYICGTLILYFANVL